MPPKSPSYGFASAAVFFAASIWGLYWVPLRYLEGEGISGVIAISLINIPAGLVLLGLTFWHWHDHKGHWKNIAWIGVMTGAAFALYTGGLVFSTIVKATLLFYLTPIWATLIGLIWLGERANWQRWAAIVLGLVGMVLLVAGDGFGGFGIGDIFALMSGVFWAVGASLVMKHDEVPIAGMTMALFLATGAFILGIGFVTGDIATPDPELFVSVLPLSFVVSILFLLPAVWVIFWAQKFLYPGRVGLLMMSEVLVAMATASYFLPDEHLGLVQWGGAFLIISACFVEVLAPAPQDAEAT